MSKLEIRGIFSVNGRVLGANSPTDYVKKDIVTEMGTCTAYIGYINKLCLVDNNGQERDCTTDLTYQDNAPSSVSVKGSIQASAAYTVASIRAYAGDNPYFETSYSVSLNQGDVLDITLTITATLSCSLSGSATQDHCVSDGFIANLLRKLIYPGAGATPSIVCLKNANLMYFDDVENTYKPGLTIALSLTYDQLNFKVNGSGSGTAQIDFQAKYLMYDNGASPAVDMVEQWFTQDVPIYNGTVVNVSFEFSIQ